MSAEIFTCANPDGIKLRVERVASCLAITVADAPECCAIALNQEQEAGLREALSPPLREQVRAVLAAVDELKDEAEQAELRRALAAHLRNTAPAAMGLGLQAVGP